MARRAVIEPTKRGANRDRLNSMQRMFVEELLADANFNATTAARKAGYKSPASQASKLLQLRSIRAILGKAIQERITRCRLTADAVLEHLRVALFLDPLDLFERTAKGRYIIRNLEDVPEEVRRCITKIKYRSSEKRGRVEKYLEVELMSKDAALVNAMKHLMLVNPDVGQMNVNVGGVDLRDLLERVESERNVIDAQVIRRIAEDGEDA